MPLKTVYSDQGFEQGFFFIHHFQNLYKLNNRDIFSHFLFPKCSSIFHLKEGH